MYQADGNASEVDAATWTASAVSVVKTGGRSNVTFGAACQLSIDEGYRVAPASMATTD